MKLRVVFMGTPAFAVPSFEALADAHEMIAVVTQPDRPQGRGLALTAPPIKIAAQRRGIPVFQPDRIRSAPAVVETLTRLAPDLIAVVAFGQILPQSVLDIPRLGCVNLHASLLPKHRGAAPIQWALIRGAIETGVTLMKMDAGMDTGPMLLARATPIAPDETATGLAIRLAALGAPLWEEALDQVAAGALTPVPQISSEATLAPRLTQADGEVRWGDPAWAIFNRWRGVTLWPGTSAFHEGRRWKITRLAVGRDAGVLGAPGEILRLTDDGLEVAAGAGYIVVQEMQPEGGRKMTPRTYAAGHPIRLKTMFTQQRGAP